jgi:periplasmic copper chaperone A
MLLSRLASPLFLSAALWAGAVSAQTVAAPVQAENAWVRATVVGQKATGAFMRLTASSASRLVRAESAAAGVTEIHEMKMEGDVMKMRAIAGLDLPAGQAVELKPGGYHVMLMDLKAPLAQGTQVPLTLVFQDAQGTQSQLSLQLPVSAKMPGAMAGHGAGHGAMRH